MSYQVLARKYRPQRFEDVVGQTPIVTTLQNAVRNNRIHHAYLFSGLRGVGKTTVARLMAKCLNCSRGDAPVAEPCNACPSCLEIAACRSIDVLEIDGASNRGIDAVRELRETVRYAPARDRFKVYIIDEVHMLTPEAWNALLKTLEEPPAHVVFLFATTDYRKLPLTILSRCQHFEFRKIPAPEMAAHLRAVAEGEGAAVPCGVLEMISRMAEGSLRDAQSALDQVIAFSGPEVTDELARTILGVIDRDLIHGFYAAVRARDDAALIGIIETVFEKGYQPVPFLEDLMAFGRDLLLARVLPDAARVTGLDAAETAALARRAAAWSDDELLRVLELMTREEQRLKTTAHPRYLLEAMAIKMARLADLVPVEQLLAQIDKAPEEPGGPAPGNQRPRSDPPRPEPGPPPGPPLPGRRDVATAAPPRDGGVERRGQAIVESILKRVHDQRGALGGFLEQAAWLEADDEALTIAFTEQGAFFREKVEARDAVEFLRTVAREIAGTALEVRVTTTSAMAASGAPPPAAAESEEERKKRLRERALGEPLVRSLLDAFGGTLVDVESA